VKKKPSRSQQMMQWMIDLETEFRSADGINPTDSIAQDRYAAALGGLDFLLSLRFNRER
jgi:hypothetical protein